MTEDLQGRLTIALSEELAKEFGDGSRESIVGGALIDVLIDLITSLMEGCLGSGQSVSQIAHTAAEPNAYQESVMRRRLIRNYYGNRRSRYYLEGGPRVLRATWATAKRVDLTDAETFVAGIDDQRIKTDDPWSM